MTAWWESFFDADYIRVWGSAKVEDRTQAEVDGLWQLLGLTSGSRVLDAPCGYGRLSRPLAARGAQVLGVDQSAELLAKAERERGGAAHLGYLRHDLRAPLAEGDFDVAINVFSSLGYGSEEDDRAILRTLAGAVRPGGLVLVETTHRDMIVARASREAGSSQRLADGTLVVEEPRFDPIAGRIETTWYWSGPSGSGAKSASLRVYAITELVAMLELVGLRFRAAHRGCSPEPFTSAGPNAGGRVGLLAARP